MYYQGGLSISQGENALRQARTTLRTDQRNLLRDEDLLRQGYVARQVVDQQLETVRNDEQTLESEEANVTANGSLSGSGLQASAVEQARATADQIRVQITKATIVSPVDGTVVNRNLNPGEYPGSRTIFVVQQDDSVYAELNASSADVFRIARGSSVSLSIPGETSRAYAGRVVGVLGQVQPGSTNFTVKALIPNANGQLVSGLPVTGTISLAATTGIGIPTTAFLDDSHSTIFVVGTNGTAQLAKVTEVASDGTTSIVTGLSAGTMVISNGQLGITAGQQIDESASPAPNASSYPRR
jgi:RND family efflux transporter MFP subunit